MLLSAEVTRLSKVVTELRQSLASCPPPRPPTPLASPPAPNSSSASEAPPSASASAASTLSDYEIAADKQAWWDFEEGQLRRAPSRASTPSRASKRLRKLPADEEGGR